MECGSNSVFKAHQVLDENEFPSWCQQKKIEVVGVMLLWGQDLNKVVSVWK